MKIDDVNLKDAFQLCAALKGQTDRKQCPSSKAIANSFGSSASIRKKRRIIDHIAMCSCCRDEFMFFYELNNFYYLPKEISEKINEIKADSYINKIKSPRYTLFWRYSFTALFSALIIISIFLFIKRNAHIETSRSKEADLVLIYPINGHILLKPLIFQWQEHKGAQYYILELFDEALLPIWTSDKIYDTRIQLPDEKLSELIINKKYFWMITGFSDMNKIDESRLAIFMVTKWKHFNAN